MAYYSGMTIEMANNPAVAQNSPQPPVNLNVPQPGIGGFTQDLHARDQGRLAGQGTAPPPSTPGSPNPTPPDTCHPSGSGLQQPVHGKGSSVGVGWSSSGGWTVTGGPHGSQGDKCGRGIVTGIVKAVLVP